VKNLELRTKLVRVVVNQPSKLRRPWTPPKATSATHRCTALLSKATQTLFARCSRRTLALTPPDAANIIGNMPLFFSADAGHADVVCALLAAGARANPFDLPRLTPLHCAVGRGTPMLLTRMNRGDTPLHLPVVQGRANAVCALLEAGASVHARGVGCAQGETPLTLAVRLGHAFDHILRALDARFVALAIAPLPRLGGVPRQVELGLVREVLSRGRTSNTRTSDHAAARGGSRPRRPRAECGVRGNMKGRG
jgi:ankyrin repeat protein